MFLISLDPGILHSSVGTISLLLYHTAFLPLFFLFLTSLLPLRRLSLYILHDANFLPSNLFNASSIIFCVYFILHNHIRNIQNTFLNSLWWSRLETHTSAALIKFLANIFLRLMGLLLAICLLFQKPVYPQSRTHRGINIKLIINK